MEDTNTAVSASATFISRTPTDVRADQIATCWKLYETIISPKLFADPLVYNELNGKLIGEFIIPVDNASRFGPRLCSMLQNIINEANPGWEATVCQSIIPQHTKGLFVVMHEE